MHQPVLSFHFFYVPSASESRLSHLSLKNKKKERERETNFWSQNIAAYKKRPWDNDEWSLFITKLCASNCANAKLFERSVCWGSFCPHLSLRRLRWLRTLRRWAAAVVPPGQWGAEPLHLTEVNEKGAVGAVHTVEGIAGVRCPACPHPLVGIQGGNFQFTKKTLIHGSFIFFKYLNQG